MTTAVSAANPFVNSTKTISIVDSFHPSAQ
jgi:hypothetical protein